MVPSRIVSSGTKEATASPAAQPIAVAANHCSHNPHPVSTVVLATAALPRFDLVRPTGRIPLVGASRRDYGAARPAEMGSRSQHVSCRLRVMWWDLTPVTAGRHEL